MPTGFDDDLITILVRAVEAGTQVAESGPEALAAAFGRDVGPQVVNGRLCGGAIGAQRIPGQQLVGAGPQAATDLLAPSLDTSRPE